MQENTNKETLETLQEIKQMMDRSVRFISLSGLSGVWAGCVALVGAAWARWEVSKYYARFEARGGYLGADFGNLRLHLLLLAASVLILAILGAYFFTLRKVQRQGGKFWTPASRQLLYHFAVPLITGGVFVLGMLRHDSWQYVSTSFLVFYGLALVNASKFTLSDIGQLGLAEIALGLVCLFVPGYSLEFWTVGFGVLHILYGIIMWRKYDV